MGTTQDRLYLPIECPLFNIQGIWYYFGNAINYKPGHAPLILKIWSCTFLKPLLLLSCVGPGNVGWQDNHDRTCQLHNHHTTSTYSILDGKYGVAASCKGARSLEEPSLHRAWNCLNRVKCEFLVTQWRERQRSQLVLSSEL